MMKVMMTAFQILILVQIQNSELLFCLSISFQMIILTHKSTSLSPHRNSARVKGNRRCCSVDFSSLSSLPYFAKRIV